METVLVREYRSDLLECVHSGHIAIVGEGGLLKGYAGDPGFVTFTRSAAKPLQAIPGIRAGIAEHYGFTPAEIALMTASHRGEDYHIATLERISAKIGIDESDMICSTSYPLHSLSREQAIRGQGKRKLYHNCSGKHMGILAYSKLKGLPLEEYAQPDYPVQKEIIETLAGMAGIPAETIGLGTDGCGLPVFALPLKSLAAAYLKLASPDLIQDEPTRMAVIKITAAMNAHPEMVAGHGRLDSILLADDNIVAKGGFKGVYCFGLRRERLGICFKILDGSEEEWGLIVRSILDQLGYSHKNTLEKLRTAFSGVIYNDGGTQVGHADTGFKLTLT
ncbi:asparaginase [Paenibacillus albidus]|uniref:asparaginase n=1 Tax=Paenibacillus albidus TaxID=2041023 RepID=UPI001BE5ABDC|nr:asparaginase [Paenibacillus albidus]MBT2292481.1 asparaginase [Paenibacillus albidus]